MMSKLLSYFGRYASLLLTLLAASNLYLAFSASSASRREYCVTNYVEQVSFVTNVIECVGSISSPSNTVQLSNALDDVPVREVARCPYDYFMVGRVIGARMYGRYYYDGSLCSWGRIDSVWPDRILLADGNWITNAKVDYINNEVLRNDRRSN